MTYEKPTTATPAEYRAGLARPGEYLGTGRNRSYWLARLGRVTR